MSKQQSCFKEYCCKITQAGLGCPGWIALSFIFYNKDMQIVSRLADMVLTSNSLPISWAIHGQSCTYTPISFTSVSDLQSVLALPMYACCLSTSHILVWRIPLPTRRGKLRLRTCIQSNVVYLNGKVKIKWKILHFKLSI